MPIFRPDQFITLVFKLKKLRFIVLFALFFLHSPEAYVQVKKVLRQGDTLSYTIKSRKKGYLEVSAAEANMVIGYY